MNIPTFNPTLEEFQDFKKYISSIKEQCHYGLAKIVPPKEWLESKGMEKVREKYNKIEDYKILDPIRQYVEGSKGTFRVTNVIEKKSMSVATFREMANKEFEKCNYIKKQDDDNEIRRKFWKNVTFSPPIYGADSSGTLFENNVEAWNLNNLNCLLRLVGTNVPGINTPYLYFGMWKGKKKKKTNSENKKNFEKIKP